MISFILKMISNSHPLRRSCTQSQLEEASGGELRPSGEGSVQWLKGQQSQPPESLCQLHYLLRFGRLPDPPGGLVTVHRFVG